MIELGMRGHDISCDSIEKVAELAKANEVKFIQLALRKSMGDISWKTGMFNVGFAEHIRRTLAAADVRISVLGCYINLLDEGEALENQVEMFREMLKFAKYCNAGAIGLETGFCNGGKAVTCTEENYQKFVSRIKPLVTEAEKLGIMVAVEPVSSHTLCTPQRVAQFLNDINSPNVSIIYDAVNALSVDTAADQKAFIDECFDAYGDKIAFIHLKDFKIIDGKKCDVDTCTGNFDFEYLFSKIKAEKPYIDMILDGFADLTTLDFIRETLGRIWDK